MNPLDRCDGCSRFERVTQHIALNGLEEMLCSGCLDWSVQLRSALVKIDLLEHRMRAQARQQDRLQAENERLRDLLSEVQANPQEVS